MDLKKILQNHVDPILVINDVITRAKVVVELTKMVHNPTIRRANSEEIARYLEIESKSS